MDHLILLAIAVLNCATAILAWRTHQQSAQNGETIVKLEKNTNSIKDALVKATGEASFAAGETKAREAGEAKAAELLKQGKK